MKAARAPLLAVTSVALLLSPACTCGSKSGEDEQAAERAEQRAQERKAVKALADSLGPAPSTERPPLVVPGQKPGEGEAAERYEKARAEAVALLEDGEIALDQVRAEVRRWPAAPEPLRALGAAAKAQKVADLLAEGAARPEGALSAASGPEDSSGAWEQTAAAAIASALERAAAGEPVEAAWSLLAVARFGHDLARGSGPGAIPAAARVTRSALAALRAVVDGASAESLPADALEELLAALQTLADSTPSHADILAGDQRRRVQKLVALYEGEATDSAVASDALAQVAREEKLEATLGALRKAESGRAHPRLALLKKAASSLGDGRNETQPLSSDLLARWLLVRADLAATFLALALRHDLPSRRKLAPSLEALEQTRGALPKDPIGRRPFEYIDDNLGGRLLRSRPIELAGEAVTVEVPIPAPRR